MLTEPTYSKRRPLNHCFCAQGFTLIEMLTVMIILAIMAMIIVPKVSTPVDEARDTTLRASLAALRSAIDRYTVEHNHTFPGVNDFQGLPAQNEAQAEQGFLRQLTQFSDINGDTSDEELPTHTYGPYLRQDFLPDNPVNERNNLAVDIQTKSIAAISSDGTTGWKYYTQSGILIANDGEHDGY